MPRDTTIPQSETWLEALPPFELPRSFRLWLDNSSVGSRRQPHDFYRDMDESLQDDNALGDVDELRIAPDVSLSSLSIA